jgi:hypothetical protein
MALCDFIGRVIVASIARIFAVGRGMAGLTGNFAAVASVVQREGMFPQGGGAPGLVSMAVFAARAKEPGVDRGVLVAGNALRRGPAELVVFVAVRALQIGVLSVQGKYHHVVETVQAVHPVMANQAVCAILLDVLIHKGRVVCAVATLARLWIEGQLLPGVAGSAQHGRLVVIHGVHVERELGGTVVKGHVINFGRAPIKSGVAGRAVGAEHSRVALWFLMAGYTVGLCAGERIRAVAVFTFQRAVFARQREIGKRVVERNQGRLRGVKIAAFMFLVAGGAGARLFETPVKPIALRYLGVDVLMAVQALASLVGLEWGVAEAALRFEFGVGMESSQHDPGCFFSADLTRIKDQTTSKP